MKKVIAIGMLVAGISAFGGSSYEDWFTPSSGWGNQTVPVNIQFSTVDWTGKVPVTVTLNDALNLLDSVITQDVPPSAKNAFSLSKAALANSIFAACQAQMNKVKIDNLGAALEGVFVNTYGQYQDEAGNVISKTKSGIDTSSLRQQLIANKNAVVSGGQASGGSESNPLKLIITQKPYDELQFEQHKADGKSLTSLKGWYDLQDNPQDDALGGADYWAFGTYGYYFPISWGKSTELEWARWNGWDESCLSAGDDGGTGSQNNKPLHLRHWNGGDGGCRENLQNLLTNKNQSIAADRKKHYFLTRYGENNAQTHELHWLSMDEAAMETGGEPNVDDHSIVLAKDEDASSNDAPKKLRLKGFDAAKSARTADGKVPIVPNIQPTGEDLAWTSFSDFFADSVFKTSDTTGKVLLNGTKEGDKKLQVLALQYGDTDDDQTLSHFSGDGKSIDLGFTPDGQTVESPLAQLHNFDNPERNGAKTEYDIADILTNVNHSTGGWYFPLRNAQGVLQYAQASKITGIPSASVDGKTIENTRDTDASETAPTKLRIFGSQTATEGQVLKMGKGGEVVWDDGAGGAGLDCEVADNDKFPLYTNTVDGVVRFGLQNWETLDNVNGVYGKKESNPVMWRMDDSRSLVCDETYDTIEVANSVNAANRAIPFKDKTNSEGDTIGWLAPPSSNPNGKYLKVTGTGNNTTLAWDDGGSGAQVDDASITTNYNHGATQNGMAGIYGFRTADAGDVPHKKYDGTIEWKSVDGSSVDDVTTTTNVSYGAVVNGKISIRGFGSADDREFPVVSKTGSKRTLDWVSINGGTGVSVSKGDNGDFIISQSAIDPGQSETGGNYQSITFVSDIWYDSSSHVLKATKKIANAFIVGTVQEEEITVFQATSHSNEHVQ